LPVRIRLTRMGKKGQPFYRVIVANSDAPRDGRFIDRVGFYDPMKEPSQIELDEEKTLHWLRKGAQPTESVLSLLRRTGLLARYEAAHKEEREWFAAKRQARRAARPPRPPLPPGQPSRSALKRKKFRELRAAQAAAPTAEPGQ
jgi:small subunit ribosomal protein S16